jgi:VanZ family protein
MFWRYLLPGISWLIALLLLSLTPGNEMPHVNNIFAFDKIMHSLFYAGLTHLWLVGLKKQYRSVFLKRHTLRIVVPSAILLGVLVEILQGTVVEGRFFEGWDIVANSVGCFIGVLFFRIIYGKEILFRHVF